MINEIAVPSRINRYANIALRKALKGKGKHRLAAITVNGSRIFSCETNRMENLMHAEVRALNRVPQEERANVTLIVVRARKNCVFGLAAPCRACREFLLRNGVKEIYYSENGTELKKFDILDWP